MDEQVVNMSDGDEGREPIDGRCNARRRQGDDGRLCRRYAGQATSHVGTGRCNLHGGSTRNQVTAANKEIARRAVATYGLPREVDPRDALLEEVHRTAGIVDWLGHLVAELDHGGVGYRKETVDGDEVLTPLSGLKQLDRAGKFEKPSVWVELFQAERKHLREVCRDAIAAGIEERRVKLAEQQGALLAGAVRAILHDLGLSEDQWALVPEIVPRHLRALSAAPEAA